MGRSTRKFHIDKRAKKIIDAETNGADDDELLNTEKVADWLGVSTQWLEIGRVRGYGPKFERLSPRMVRYRKASVLAWLKSRTHASTSEYAS